MNLRQLEIFRAVMQTGSTKNAARLLSISQPAVSNMLRQFEDQLGFKLFERIGGRLRATREADVLLDRSEQLFANFDAVQELAEDIRDTQAGTLKILASPSFGQSVIPQAIATFLEDRPNVNIGFDTPTHDYIVDLLNSNQADFGITNTPIDHPGIESNIIRHGKLICALPTGHPLTNKKTIRPRDLRGAQLISYPRSSPVGLIVDEAFREVGECQQVKVNVRYFVTACHLVEAGAGVAVVDEFTKNGEKFTNIVTRPFKTKQQAKISLSHSRLRPLSRLAKEFVENYLWRAGRADPGPA